MIWKMAKNAPAPVPGKPVSQVVNKDSMMDHIRIIPFKSQFAEATMYVEVTPDEGGTEYISKTAHQAMMEAAVGRAFEMVLNIVGKRYWPDHVRAIASEAMRYIMKGDE
jgi:hypothetical protein